MIGSSCLGTSSWNSDPLLGRSLDIFDYDQLESGFCAFERKRDQSSCSASPEHSSSSDDCDWMTFGDMSSILPVVDSLACELLEKESIIDSLDLSDLDWVSLSDTRKGETSATESASDRDHNVVEAPRKKRRRTKSPKSVSNSKSWSRMTTEERLRTAHALSDIISQRMNLSHQIEVIKLIDPSAVLSPNATEFTINLSYLNDAKLKRIQEYVRKYAVLKSDTDDTEKPLTGSQTKSSSSNNRHSNCHPGKRRQKKYKSPYVNELKLRERKVIQQDKKEKRSGLFVMEKIIRKLSDPSEEDEDVNILE